MTDRKFHVKQNAAMETASVSLYLGSAFGDRTRLVIILDQFTDNDRLVYCGRVKDKHWLFENNF